MCSKLRSRHGKICENLCPKKKQLNIVASVCKKEKAVETTKSNYRILHGVEDKQGWKDQSIKTFFFREYFFT